MCSIEVLIATTHQNDAELYYELGLKTDAIIANQTDSYWFKEVFINGNTVKVIATNDRGVGKNRNLALLHATADLCAIGDDDLLYNPDYPEIIRCAFDELPNADIIIFNIVPLNTPNNGIPDKRRITKIKKVGLLNFGRYGAPGIVFKRESLLKANIWFSLLYGGGAKYSAGEDSLFLREALKKGLKVYTYPAKLAEERSKTSTWFRGYTEKFFFDKGVIMANMFPKLKYLVGFYMVRRFRTKSKFTAWQILKLVCAGIKGFRNGISYEEWREYHGS